MSQDSSTGPLETVKSDLPKVELLGTLTTPLFRTSDQSDGNVNEGRGATPPCVVPLSAFSHEIIMVQTDESLFFGGRGGHVRSYNG